MKLTVGGGRELTEHQQLASFFVDLILGICVAYKYPSKVKEFKFSTN